MKICAISDTHGYLPEIPPCDIFIHGGDICPVVSHKLTFQNNWILQEFKPWIDKIQAKHKIIIWGNHDFIGQEYPGIKYGLNCEVLTEELIECEGLKIWGSPWTKKFFDWAFNATAKNLYKLHTNIPPCDIIVTHGPPYGFGDLVNRKDSWDIPFKSHAGSPGLMKRILDIEPKLVIGGHIHSGFGIRQFGNTTIANVSHVSEGYKPVNSATVFEL